MSDIGSRLIRLENLGVDKSRLLRFSPNECFLGKIFYVTEGRNAWNHTWSTKYVEESSFQLSDSEARDVVERWRVQGSQWKIRELACCVLRSEGYSLVVTEINSNAPLSKFALEGRVPGSSLHQFALWFAPTGRNSVIRLVTRSPAILKHDGSSKVYTSSSRGGRIRLRWNEYAAPPAGGRYDTNHVIRLVEEGRSLLEHAVLASGGEVE